MRTRALLAALLLAPAVARGELVQDGGAWIVGSGEGDLSAIDAKLARVRWWFDAQLRLYGATDGLGQSVLRPALGYALAENTSVWLGYAWVHTEPARGGVQDENRIWQQFLWTHAFSDFGFAWRTRLEERMLTSVGGTSWRLRQLWKLSHPLPLSPRLGVVLYEEPFFTLNATTWAGPAGFSENRAFAGFSWKFNDRVTAELGYLSQYVRTAAGPDVLNHLAAVQLFFR